MGNPPLKIFFHKFEILGVVVLELNSLEPYHNFDTILESKRAGVKNKKQGVSPMKKWIVLVVFISILTIYGCGHGQKKTGIVASIPPLASFAKAIGGNTFSYSSVVPTTANPHIYEPLPDDIVKAKKAVLFIYVGDNIDPWAAKLAKETENRSLEVIKAIRQKHVIFENPHVWLDPLLVPVIVQAIADTLSSIYPESSAVFKRNLEDYTSRLERAFLDARAKIAKLPNRNILVYHGAWAPMLRNIGLNVVAIISEHPAQEPSAKRVSDVIRLAKSSNVKIVVAEENFPTKIPKKIAEAIGAKLIVVNPLYSDDFIVVLQNLTTQIVTAIQEGSS